MRADSAKTKVSQSSYSASAVTPPTPRLYQGSSIVTVTGLRWLFKVTNASCAGRTVIPLPLISPLLKFPPVEHRRIRKQCGCRDVAHTQRANLGAPLSHQK